MYVFKYNDATIFRFILDNEKLKVRCKYYHGLDKSFLYLIYFEVNVNLRYCGYGSAVLNRLLSLFKSFHENILGNKNKLDVFIFNYKSLFFQLLNEFNLVLYDSFIEEKDNVLLKFFYFLNNICSFSSLNKVNNNLDVVTNFVFEQLLFFRDKFISDIDFFRKMLNITNEVDIIALFESNLIDIGFYKYVNRLFYLNKKV